SAATGDACAGPAPACPAPDRRRVRDDASMSGHNAAGAEFPQRFFLPACAPALEVCLLFSITAQRPDKFHRLAVSVQQSRSHRHRKVFFHTSMELIGNVSCWYV